MIKSLLVATAMLLAAPTFAQTPDAAPVGAERPFCSAKVTDGCQQTKAQQARAMTGEQVDARDARNGGKWTPDMTTTKITRTVKKTKKVAAK